MDAKGKNSNSSASQAKNDAFVRKFAKALLALNAALVVFTLGLLVWNFKEEGKFSFSACGVLLAGLANGFLAWRALKGRPL